MGQESSIFRRSIGIIAVLGGLLGMAGLYLVPIPEGNREPLLLALGLVLGWGSTVIGYEYGSSPAGRQAASVGIRQAEAAVPAPQSAVDAANQTAEAATDRAAEIEATATKD